MERENQTSTSFGSQIQQKCNCFADSLAARKYVQVQVQVYEGESHVSTDCCWRRIWLRVYDQDQP